MNKYKILILSFLSILFFTFQNFDFSKQEDTLFLGYYGSAGWNKDFTDEVLDHTNLIWVRENDEVVCKRTSKVTCPVEASHTTDILFDLKRNHPHAKAMLDPSPVFMNEQEFKLYPDYKFRWNKYIENIHVKYGRDFYKNIAAFYLPDEAYANALGKGIKPALMKIELEKITSTIKGSFPKKPIAMSYTMATLYKALDKYPIPERVDWIGVDCYGDWENCVYGKKKVPMEKAFNYLSANLKPHQRLILFPDALLKEDNATRMSREDREKKVIEITKKYYKWAQSHSNVVGVFPFIWQSGGSHGTSFTGLRDMDTKVISEIKKLNRELLGKKVILPEIDSNLPNVIAAGRGCTKLDCIWIVVDNIESSTRVGIRYLDNNSYTPDLIIPRDKLNINFRKNGGKGYVITFRITNSNILSALDKEGLNIWVVNPQNKKWTKKYIRP